MSHGINIWNISGLQSRWEHLLHMPSKSFCVALLWWYSSCLTQLNLSHALPLTNKQKELPLWLIDTACSAVRGKHEALHSFLQCQELLMLTLLTETTHTLYFFFFFFFNLIIGVRFKRKYCFSCSTLQFHV